MFLSKFLKHTRAKALIALAGLTMVFGVGATISVSVTQTANNAIEVSAGASYGTSDYLYVNTAGYWPKVDKIQLLCRWQDSDSGQSYGGAVTTKLYDDVWQVYFPSYGNTNYLCIIGYENNSWQKSIWFDNNIWASWTQWHSMPSSGQLVTLSSASSLSSVSNAYTVTFNQNDGTGYSVARLKAAGQTFTVPSLASLGMGASVGRCFLRWHTTTSGTGGTDYVENSTYKTDAALNLYMIQDWYKYEYSTDGTNWVAIDDLKATPTSGYIGELVTSSTHALVSGETLSFKKYYGTGSHTSVDIEGYSGNLNGSGAIKYSYTGNVAIRVRSDGKLFAYADGDGSRQIFVNSTPYGLYFSSNYDGYTNVSIALYPNDVIKGGYNGGSYSAGLLDGDGDFSIVNGDVTCHAPGVFTIHLRSDDGENFPNVSFEMDDSASATLFAQTFNAAISTVCTGITGGTKTVSTDLVTAWGSSSSSGQNRYYNSLTSEAKALITKPTSDSDISTCIDKYDYVCGKYGPNGTKNLPDFMGRNPSKPASAGVIPGAPMGTESPLTTTLWIVLASGAAGLSAIGAAYFISKRKKRNRA